MTAEKEMPPSKRGLALAGFIAMCFIVAAIGGAVTATSVGDWYPTLIKPPYNPPNSIFSPVWTLLFLMMAVAAWRVWRRPPSTDRQWGLRLFALQLALNLLWSILFFGLKRIDLAAVEIGLFLIVIATNTVYFFRADRIAGWLFVPYVAWVGFATVLNISIWGLNPTV